MIISKTNYWNGQIWAVKASKKQSWFLKSKRWHVVPCQNSFQMQQIRHYTSRENDLINITDGQSVRNEKWKLTNTHGVNLNAE